METAPAIDGATLRAVRIRVGLSQNDLARLAGLADGLRVSRWERGEARPRSAHLLRAVAEVLNVAPRDLLAAPESRPSLRWLRFAAGMSVPDLASAANCAVSTIKRWESMGLSSPSDATVDALARALSASPVDVRGALQPS